MVILPVRGAHAAVALPAFMWSARKDELALCPAFPLALTDGLLISDSPYTVDETCLVPEISVASAQGIRTPFATHGVLAMQQLHIWSYVWDTSLRHPLPHALHTNFLVMAVSDSLSHDNAR